MRFWDSSAILPLLVEEPTSKEVRIFFKEDDEIAIWWGTGIECLSALSRKEREGELTLTQYARAEERLRDILEWSIEINPSTEVKKIARRLLRVHALRTADALQLASALFLAGGNVEGLTMVTFDKRLRESAQLEGLKIGP